MSDARTDLLITGTGSLSAAILHSITRAGDCTLRVIVMGRDSERLRWIVRSVAARAACFGMRLQIEAVQINWNDHDAICRLLADRQPRLILHTASLQSPWALNGCDGWSRLVKTAGYGITLPLHLVLAQRIGRAMVSVVPDALFINACYPDATNPILRADSIPVLCGIGNVAILTALMPVDGKLSPGKLQMIAHHAHVATAISGVDRSLQFLRAWCDDEPIDEQARRWVREARLPGDERLNVVTGVAASQVAMCLLGFRDSLRTNLPGPLGLPGGYPVSLEHGKLSLNLPSGLAEQEAVQCNRAAGLSDGIAVDAHGIARLSDEAVAEINDLPKDFRVLTEPLPSDLVEARANVLIQLRSRLSEPQLDLLLQ